MECQPQIEKHGAGATTLERPFDFLIAAAANCGLLPLSWRHGVIPAWLNSRAISERRGLPPIRGSKRGNVVRLDLDALRAARKER